MCNVLIHQRHKCKMCKTCSCGLGNTSNTCHFAAVNTSGIQWDRRNTKVLMFNNHVHPLEICFGRKKLCLLCTCMQTEPPLTGLLEKYVPALGLFVKQSSSTSAPRRSYLALAFSLTLSWTVHIWCFAINMHTVNSFPTSTVPDQPNTPSLLLLYTCTTDQTPI